MPLAKEKREFGVVSLIGVCLLKVNKKEIIVTCGFP